MTGFKISTERNQVVRFHFYSSEAPVTTKAFIQQLPFKRVLFHARLSGQEIWTDDAPEIDIIQENASVFTEPGEIVLGPLKPTRNKTSKCLGIYYGDGKGLDGCNIFGKVFPEDLPLLKQIGEEIWKNGSRELTFELL